MKKFYESKTVWFGVATAVLSTLTFFQGEEWVKEYPQIVTGIGAAIGVLTIVIRYLTTSSMELTRVVQQKLRK